MSNVINLKGVSPLVGTWGALDDDGTTVEYTIASTPTGLSVLAKDTYDGEIGAVSEVEQSSATLMFTVKWSTGRVCRCRVQPGSRDQVQFTFTYTEHEHLQLRAP